MKAIFRADGSNNTGLGHIYRLLAIAEMVKEEYECIFVTRYADVARIIPKEYLIGFIDKDIELLDEPLWMSNIYDPKEYLIILDGYDFRTEYQRKLKSVGFALLYVDDLNEFHICSDIIINHSSAVAETDYKAETYTTYALGTDYAMLRPGFLKAAKQYRAITEIDTAFVCFGGSDKFDLSYRTVKALLKSKKIRKIHLVVGASYVNDGLNDLREQYPDTLEIYKSLSESDLIKVIDMCNIAICSASTVLYELMSIKIPLVSGYYVDNQKSIYNWFNNNGCFIGVDDFLKFDFLDLNKIIDDRIDRKIIDDQIKNQAKYIDGRQQERFLGLFSNISSSKKPMK